MLGDQTNTNSNGGFKPLSRPKLSLHRFLFYFITLAALAVIYLKFSELRLLKEVFLKSNLWWLAGILVTQGLNYYFQALNYQNVLRVKDLEVKSKELFPMTFVVQFLNQALPSVGLSGQVFFVQYLKKYGLTIAEGIGRAILELMTLYMAFGVFFIVSAAMMLRSGILKQHPEGWVFVYAFAFFAVIGLGLFFVLQRRGRSRVAKWLIDKIHAYFEKRNNKKNLDKSGTGIVETHNGANHAGHIAMIFDQFKTTVNYHELKKRGRPFWKAFFWQNMIFLANIFTLYFLAFALNFQLGFIAAFITFTLVKFLSMVSFVPGALGVFEGGMTLILITFGVPAQSAFAVTLLFRAFTFWFPMPVGWVLYRWYLHRQELENPYDS